MENYSFKELDILRSLRRERKIQEYEEEERRRKAEDRKREASEKRAMRKMR